MNYTLSDFLAIGRAGPHILTVQGDVLPIRLKGKFTLKRLQLLVGGLIELVHLPSDLILIIDEEGKMKMKKPNQNATIAAGFDPALDHIVGDAIICKQDLMN